MGTDRNEKLITIIAVALLGIFVLQAILSAGDKSPTMDEQNHIARGYAYLRTGDLRLSQEHPPLINTISALPLLVIRPQLPTDHPSWDSANWYAFADQLLWHATDSNGKPITAQNIVNWARLPIILLGLLLGMGVYAWAAELYGSIAGLLALGLYVFSPNILAHSRLCTNDIGVACFIFFALYAFWRFITRPSTIGIVAAGVALGLALAAKFSALVLLPILALLVLFYAWRKQPRPDPPAESGSPPLSPDQVTTAGPPAGVELYPAEPVRPAQPPWWRLLEWKWALYLAAIVAIGLAVVWGIYGLELGPLNGNGSTLPMPSYWNGIKTILERTESGNPTFLAGRYSQKGWWYYFPAAFVIKTSLPMLLLLALALTHTARRRNWRAEMWLLLPVAIYSIISMGSSLNIGYRHLLPILPLLFVYASKIANCEFQIVNRRLQTAISNILPLAFGLLVCWQAFSALQIYPHYLAYFNEFVHGPENGYKYLVDSNLDWGQDLPALQDYLEKKDIDQIYLSWFGPAYPEQYGINYRPLPGFPLQQGSPQEFAFNPYRPAPGLYAISATNLQGAVLPDHDTFAWFRDVEPLAQPGYSLFIYRVPEPKGLPHSVVFGSIGYHDLPADRLTTMLARPNTFVRAFDPPAGFIAPSTGETDYIVSDLLPFAPALRQRVLNQAQVVTQEQDYAIYRLDASPLIAEEASLLAEKNPVWWSSAVDFSVGDPSQLLHPITLPVNLRQTGDTLSFLGYNSSYEKVAAGQEIALTTYWRALDQAQPSITIFAHLLDTRSKIWAGWDGLNVSPHGWRRGDIIVQHIRLSIPANAPPGEYQIEIGVYTSRDGRRFLISTDDEPVADRLLLRPLQVTE